MLSVPFVGRRVELEALADALGSACRLVLVTGDAGVGKTRLVTEAARCAANDGSLVLQTACLPLDVKLPLLPFIEALRGLASIVGPAALAGALTGMSAQAVAQLARLAPEVVGRDATDDVVPGQQWQQTRLFGAVDQVLAQAAGGRHMVLVVEDVHWADSATLDLVTYLRASRSGAARTILVTCRGDEADMESHVGDWLGHTRRPDSVRLALDGLSRDELAELAAHVLAVEPSDALVDELCSRTDGNPYLAEELIAGALSKSLTSPDIVLPRRLPGELAAILVGRARRVSDAARSTLDVLAVAGRPMSERLVAQVTGLAPRVVASAMRELAEARLLAMDDARSELGCRPRHALLAEAISADLLADGRRQIHAGVAEAMQGLADPALSAEIAGHWAAAGRPDEELRALVAAAESSRRMHAFSAAAELWLRAIPLAESIPDTIDRLDVDPARLRIKAVDALRACGRDSEAGALAEETYQAYAAHADVEVGAMIRHRAANHRRSSDPTAANAVFEEAGRLYDSLPESTNHARMLADYGVSLTQDGNSAECRSVLERALEIAERTGATHEAAQALCFLSGFSMLNDGDLVKGRAMLDRARQLAQARTDGDMGIRTELFVAESESDALLTMGLVTEAANVAVQAVDRARRHGVERGVARAVVLSHAVEASVELGLINSAAELTDEVSDQAPQQENWPVQLVRAQVEMCQDTAERALARVHAVRQLGVGGQHMAAFVSQRLFAWIAVWAGDPRTALEWVERSLARFAGNDLELSCGEFFALGARAVADLAELARARRDEAGAAARRCGP